MQNSLDEYMEKNNLNNTNELVESIISNIQGSFLKSQMGQAINNGIDMGLKTVLPEFLDDQILNLKNNLMQFGLGKGIKKSVEDAINLGKTTLGVINNNYESIEEAQKVIEKGGVLDQVSGLLDSAITGLKNNRVINTTIAKELKNQKNTIIKNIENNVEKTFTDQLNNIEKLDKYIANWKECFQNQDYSGMQKEYYKMNTVMKEIMPLEKVINNYNYVESLQNLIKNNGKNFDLSNEEFELAEKLFN